MIAPKQLQFAVNTAGQNKDWNFQALSGQFQDKEGTIADVIHHVRQGHALCAGLLGGKWRSKPAFIGSQWVLVDIDNSGLLRDENGDVVKGDDGKGIKVYEHQLTIEEAIDHPFIRQHCGLIYTTASHQPNWPKFRLVFPLPEFVADIDTYEAVVRLLLDQLPHDPACKDGVRVFYGNTAAEFPLINPDAVLPSNWIEQAGQQAAREQRDRAERARIQALKAQEFRQLASDEGWDTDRLIEQALNHIPARTVGSGNYEECLRVLMALNSHYGAIEAERIAESWSPSIRGTTWNVGAKIASFKDRDGSKIGIGSLFHIAGQYGFKFPTPKQWCDEDDDRGSAVPTLTPEAERRLEERAVASIRRWADAIATRGVGFGAVKPARSPKQSREIEYVPGNLPHISQLRGRDQLPTIVYQKPDLQALVVEARAKGWQDLLDTTATGGGKSFNYANLPIGILLENEQPIAPVDDEAIGDDGEKEAMNRVWLLSATHRNPSTAPAERNFADMPVRNAGLVTDDTRQTPSGENYQRWPKAGEKPDTEGNCHLTKLFHKARSKGIVAAEATSGVNPICAMCKMNDVCGKPEAIAQAGYGFRAQRAEVFASEQRIRTRLDSLPDPADYTAFEGDTAILDEALTEIRPVDAIAVRLSDFDTAWAELETELPDIYDQLSDLRKALRPLVAGGEHQHFGYDDAALRKLLPSAPDGFIESIEAVRSVMTVDLSDLANLPDSASTTAESKAIASLKQKLARREKKLSQQQDELAELNRDRQRLEVEQGSLTGGRGKGRFKGFTWTAGEGQKLLDKIASLTQSIAELLAEISDLQAQLNQAVSDRQTIDDFNRRARRDAKNELETALDDLPMQWLIPFLEVWAEVAPGALRINPFGGMSITTRHNRHNDTLNAIGLRIYLDATATPQTLSLYRQIPVSAILHIQMQQAPMANLEFIHVQGLGLAGKGRSETCDERVAALLAELKTRHPDLVTFDWLKKKEAIGADGHWFSDFTRGTNEFSNRTAIAAVGLPMPNYGSFYDLWLTQTKHTDLKHLSFEAFYQQLTDAEITQAVGRLRANRRPDEQLTFYLIGDTEKSRSANYQPPAELNAKVMQARDITIDAATPPERAWKAATEFIKHWWNETGNLPDQQRVAAESGITQGYLSKLAGQFIGGWKRLKKIFQSLLGVSYRDWNIFEPSEDEIWIAEEFLPLVAKESSQDVAIALNETIESFTWQGWRRILSKTTAAVRYQLAWALLKDGFRVEQEAIA